MTLLNFWTVLLCVAMLWISKMYLKAPPYYDIKGKSKSDLVFYMLARLSVGFALIAFPAWKLIVLIDGWVNQ